MLRGMEKATGGQYGGKKKIDGSRAEPSNATTRLVDLGIDKKTSMVAQQLAGMPEAIRQAIAGCLRSFCMPILPYHSCRGDEDAGPRKINDLGTAPQRPKRFGDGT